MPTDPAFHGTGDGQCTSTAYCEAIYSLTQKEKIPTSQIGQLTSTDLANGVLVSGNYAGLIDRARRSPPRTARRSRRGRSPPRTRAYAQAPEAPVPAANLPVVASRPVNPSGSIGKNVVIRVPASQAEAVRAAVREARLPGRIQSRVHLAWVDDSFEAVLEGVRVGDREQRNGWESRFIAAIADRNIRMLLGQM